MPDKDVKTKEKEKTPKKIDSRYYFGIGSVVIILLLAFGVYFGAPYMSTPGHMRNPTFDHYHLRTQIVVDGQSVNFSDQEFQQEYDSNSCSAELSGQPIDFHDDADQMTHIHWDGVTGGEFLKYYGWNLIGGNDDTLGTRFDGGMMNLHKISTYGDKLPHVSENSNYYVYVGDENGYQQKNWQEFLSSDLEDFFGKESLLNPKDSTFNILDLFSDKASAHGGADDATSVPVVGETNEEKLTRINNLIGNVVIFVQENEPANEEILAKFNNLVPLTDSTCGG